MKEMKIIVLVLLAISQLLTAEDLTGTFEFAENLNIALETAKVEKKPIMVIVHKTKCPLCKTLMPQLVDNTELQALSKNFIMVNGHDGQDARAMEYVDAKYNPRIYFIAYNGKALTQVINKSSRNLRYSTAEEVKCSMTEAIKIHKKIK